MSQVNTANFCKPYRCEDCPIHIRGKLDMMKTHLLFIGAVGLLPISTVMAQIPNSGFENWTTVDDHLDPDGWMTENEQLAAFGVFTCEKGTPGAVGDAYVKLTSKVFPGTSSVITAVMAAGFPYSGRPAAWNGSVKYDIQAGDEANVTVGFYLNGVGIGVGLFSFTGTQSNWVEFSIPITYGDGSSVPDSAYIAIGSSGSDAVAGTTISFDDLSFGALNGNAGIQEAQASVGLRVYPTLATDVLNLIADQPLAEVDVLDLTGRNLMSQATQAENLPLNVSALNTGRYLLQIRLADGRRLVRSFVKQ